MRNILCHFQRNAYKLFQTKVIRKLASDNFTTVYCILRSVRYCSHNFTGSRNLVNQIYKYEGFILNMEESSPEMAICGHLQNVGEDEKNVSTECTYVSDHEQSSNSGIESLGLNMLFDIEKVVNKVKLKLKEKKEKRQIQQNVCHSNEQKSNRKKWKERKNRGTKFDQHPLKDDKFDSDSSFGLTNLFEQKKTVYKRKKAKKAKKIVKRVKKDDDSYGLEMLFSEKNIREKKNKRKSRKRKMQNYGSSETNSDDDGETEDIKVKKKRPNHFVAIRVLNPVIHLAIKDFQDALLKENEKLKPALIPLISLHITMAVMHLDEALVKIAQNALETCRVKIMEALETIHFKLTFSGVGNFNNEVVFARVAKEDQVECLKTINDVISSRFEEDGICLSDKKEWKPHLTILKLSRRKSLRKQGIKKVKEDVYASFIDAYFGEESVHNIHLCSMTGSKEHDGFYKCVSTITLSIDSEYDVCDSRSVESLEENQITE